MFKIPPLDLFSFFGEIGMLSYLIKGSVAYSLKEDTCYPPVPTAQGKYGLKRKIMSSVQVLLLLLMAI